MSLLFALYSGNKQIDAKNLGICMVHSFAKWVTSTIGFQKYSRKLEAKLEFN